MVTVNDFSVFIADNEPVAIAIQGKSDIRSQLFYLFRHHLGMQGTAILVNIFTVRVDPDAGNFCT